MNHIKKCMLSFLLVAMVSSALCHAQHMNDKDSPCPNAVTTLDMAQCFSKAKAKASSDDELVALYNKVLGRLEGDDADRLKKVEKLWNDYHEQNCSAERALYQGGSAGPVVYLACFDAMTRARITELRVTYAVRLKE